MGISEFVPKDIKAQKAKFSAVAQQISKAPGASQGGMMGWVQAEQMDKNLASAAQKLEPKSVSDPIRSLAGYHILYLIESRVITASSIPEENKVREILFGQRADRASRGRIVDLRNAAFIEYRF